MAGPGPFVAKVPSAGIHGLARRAACGLTLEVKAYLYHMSIFPQAISPGFNLKMMV
jgi:hypothetical protein